MAEPSLYERLGGVFAIVRKASGSRPSSLSLDKRRRKRLHATALESGGTNVPA